MDLLGLNQLWGPFGAVSGGGGGTPPASPGSFLEAVAAAFAAGPRASDFAGGLYLNEASRRGDMPYAVFSVPSSHLSLYTNTSQVQDVGVRFKVYAEDLDTADALAQSLRAAFGPGLAFAGGGTTLWTCSGVKPHLDHARSRPGNDLWYVAVDFRTKVLTS